MSVNCIIPSLMLQQSDCNISQDLCDLDIAVLKYRHFNILICTNVGDVLFEER